MAAGLVRQAQMIAQGLPIQLALVVAARLQDRQHLGHEIVQAFALCREAEDEAVAGTGIEPADQFVGHMLRRADEVRPRAHGFQRHLAQAQPFSRVLLDAVGGGAELLLPMSPSSGKGASGSYWLKSWWSKKRPR
jgi:hypothetical protein